MTYRTEYLHNRLMLAQDEYWHTYDMLGQLVATCGDANRMADMLSHRLVSLHAYINNLHRRLNRVGVACFA